MKCRYIYKSKEGTIHEFKNEIQLDDFLLSKIKFEELFGDLVFLLSAEALSAREKAQRIAQQTKDLKKKVKNTVYIEGIEVENYNKPYIGVTAYLNLFIDEKGHPLFPIFKPEEYWKRRRMFWTDTSQNIDEEYTSDKGTGVFTKEEKELIFGDLSPRRFNSEEEMTTWQHIIEEKWRQQGVLGEEIHHILDMFFRKYHGTYNFTKFKNDREGFIDMIIKYTEGSTKPSKEIVGQVIDYGYELLKEIRRITKNDSDIEFYPELKISGNLNESRNDGITHLVGSIDLLVVDGKGNSYIFDYKTSPKQYADYDSAKVRTFMYQLAVYNRLLQRFGFKDTENRQYILPILFDNFHLTNRDEAILDPKKAKFSYDKISWNKGAMSENLTGTINTDDKLNERLESFLPAVKIKDVDTDTILERVTEDENRLFGGQIKHKTYDDEYINNLLKDAKQNDKKEWVFELTGGYTRKPIIAKTREELHKKLRDIFIKILDGNRRRATTIIDAVKEAKANHLTVLDNEYLRNMGVIHLHDDTGNLQFLKTKLQPYLDESWVVVEDDAAKHFGCVIFKNEHSKQIDVVKISGKNLDYQLYHETRTKNGKSVKNKRRSNLTFAFETDIVEQQKTKSKMLKANVGNIESVEALLLLNEKYSLFEGGYKIGNIQIINPYTGQGSKAPNHQLEYSYKKLREHSEIYQGIDHINDNEVQFMSLLDLAESDLKEELEKEDRDDDPIRHRDSFLSCVTVLDSAQDNLSKLKSVMQLLNLLKENYGDEITQLRANSSSRAARLYNKLLLAAAELRGIEFKLQIERNDKWPSFNISKAITKGLSSSYIDNPGNLDSETLNMLTKLVTEGYQNIRTDLSKEIPTVRKLIDNLKKEKNFGWTLGIKSEVELFKNLIDNSFENDLVLKKVSDVTGAELEFLKYFLRTVNRNRFPGLSEQELDEKERNGDLDYYRLPLATASSSTEIAMNGLFNSLKNRLAKWTPANALKYIREKSEGLFTDEEVNEIDKSDTKLYEMNNRFSKTDTDEDYRLEVIEKKGKNYYEHNLETLLLDHMFAYKSKEHLDQIFPMLRAAMTHLKVMGEDEQNKLFTSDLEYGKNYIKAIVKNLPINDTVEAMKASAFTKKLREAASFVALAFSPVQGLYQTIQGLWVDLSLIIRKPDGTNAFTFSNFAKAFKIVYADLFPHLEPSKVLLLNELYAVNDMDMNTYMKNIQSNQGFLNFYDLAFKFTSRPDYYNRMTILVAQMLEEGTWDAYEVKDGKLVYNFDNDKRFEHLRKNIRGREYDYEKSLYYEIANLHIREGAKNPDGTLFKLTADKIVPLPAAHTIQEIESFKALGDLIYGYYSHEKKSLIHYHMLGALFMQMRTYWSGKKNLYLAPGGIRVQGKWVLAKDNEGKSLYYQVINGKIRTDLPPVFENTGAPVVQWQGLWQEGIFVTLSTLASGVKDYIKSTGDWDIFEAIKIAVLNKYENSEDMHRAFYNNIKLLVYDVSLYFIIGHWVAGLLVNWDKELIKESKESLDFSEGIRASLANILTLSVRNSAADFAFWESIGNPAMLWTPFSLDTGGRIFKNVWSTMMGDRTFWGGVTNTFAVTKQFKPLMLNIAPLSVPKED